jgi:hypothetical protein
MKQKVAFVLLLLLVPLGCANKNNSAGVPISEAATHNFNKIEIRPMAILEIEQKLPPRIEPFATRTSGEAPYPSSLVTQSYEVLDFNPANSKLGFRHVYQLATIVDEGGNSSDAPVDCYSRGPRGVIVGVYDLKRSQVEEWQFVEKSVTSTEECWSQNQVDARSQQAKAMLERHALNVKSVAYDQMKFVQWQQNPDSSDSLFWPSEEGVIHLTSSRNIRVYGCDEGDEALGYSAWNDFSDLRAVGCEPHEFGGPMIAGKIVYLGNTERKLYSRFRETSYNMASGSSYTLARLYQKGPHLVIMERYDHRSAMLGVPSEEMFSFSPVISLKPTPKRR